MLEARTAAAAKPASDRAATAATPAASRAKVTNDPIRARASGNSRQGRRLRDLYAAYMVALGHPAGPTTHAAVLAACELLVAAENARAALLAGDGDVDQVVRLENLAARAVRRLGLRPTNAKPPAPTLADYLQSLPPDAGDAPDEPENSGGEPARASSEPGTTEAAPGTETAPASTARVPGGDPP